MNKRELKRIASIAHALGEDARKLENLANDRLTDPLEPMTNVEKRFQVHAQSLLTKVERLQIVFEHSR